MAPRRYQNANNSPVSVNKNPIHVCINAISVDINSISAYIQHTEIPISSVINSIYSSGNKAAFGQRIAINPE